MEAVDVYEAFALFSVVSLLICVGLIRFRPGWSYAASLVIACVATDLFLSYRFDAYDRGPFYGAIYLLGAVFAALGLFVLHLGLRIASDLHTHRRRQD